MIGRPPALSLSQQHEVRLRLAAGERMRALADEYGVGKSTIARLAPLSRRILRVARQIAEAQAALQDLPAAQQHQVMALVQQRLSAAALAKGPSSAGPAIRPESSEIRPSPAGEQPAEGHISEGKQTPRPSRSGT